MNERTNEYLRLHAVARTVKLHYHLIKVRLRE